MSGLERILLMAALAIGFVVLALGGCFIVILLEPPPTERLWRTSLEASHGLERVGLIWAYRILHRKQNKRKKKEDGQKREGAKAGRASRGGLAGSQGLSASRSSSTGAADLRFRGDKQILRNDGDNHELPRGLKPGAFDRAFQDAPQGAGSEASAPSPRPADEHRENRPDPKGGSSKDLSDSAGNGGRAGSLIDEYDAPFWKKLVTHAEELGL